MASKYPKNILVLVSDLKRLEVQDGRLQSYQEDMKHMLDNMETRVRQLYTAHTFVPFLGGLSSDGNNSVGIPSESSNQVCERPGKRPRLESASLTTMDSTNMDGASSTQALTDPAFLHLDAHVGTAGRPDPEYTVLVFDGLPTMEEIADDGIRRSGTRVS